MNLEVLPSNGVPSNFQIGGDVIVNIKATVTGVTFTKDAILYTVSINGKSVTVPSQNLDPLPQPVTAQAA